MDAVGADVRTLRAEMAGNGADFICQELPADITSERARGYGFCTPTYFMFQMRIDNHPSPRG